MAERHTIETYGRAPHNRNIWQTGRRHAWPILLSALLAVVYTLQPEFHAEAPQATASYKDLPKVPTWQLERDSNPRPSGRKASTLPRRHHVPRPSLRCTVDPAIERTLQTSQRWEVWRKVCSHAVCSST